MRDDLLEAYAAIDWAEAQFNHLTMKVRAWKQSRPYDLREEMQPDGQKKIFRLCNLVRPDPILNAEVGAIINSIRTSLDLLASALAERYGIANKRGVYFPIASTSAAFFNGEYKGQELINRLSAADRKLIEDCEPWRGGNNPTLITLHDLDITRKHSRLLRVSSSPDFIGLTVQGQRTGLEMVHVWQGFEDGAIVATGGPHTQKSDVHMTLDITLHESGALQGLPLLPALQKLSGCARSIIQLFG